MEKNHIYAPPRRQTGFTLIEMMIVVVVIAILATIALPAYQEYVRRSHRAAAQAEMMDIANRQQQFFLANRQYADTLNDLGYALPDDVADRYDVDPGTDNDATPPSFNITFTPKGAQAADVELTLSSAGEKTPAEKW